jgi:hypothetical protein
MADHTRLWNHFILAVRGSKEAKHQNVGGGSVNYRLIDDTTAWILDPSPENRLTLLGHFANMKRTGHMSLAGPKGVACEQGSPAAHRKFNMAPLLAIFKFARERGDNELALAAEAVILDEVGLTQAFMFKGTSVIPAPRVKDEKGQGPVDVNRDRLSWVLRGADLRKIKTGKSFWKDDEGNLDVILARELVESRVWDDELIVMAIHSDLPLLYLDIKMNTTQSGGGSHYGFEAWIDDTPENRKVMGRDGCHFVHAAPDGIWWRVDWEPELDAEGKSNNHHLKKKGKRNE